MVEAGITFRPPSVSGLNCHGVANAEGLRSKSVTAASWGLRCGLCLSGCGCVLVYSLSPSDVSAFVTKPEILFGW